MVEAKGNLSDFKGTFVNGGKFILITQESGTEFKFQKVASKDTGSYVIAPLSIDERLAFAVTPADKKKRLFFTKKRNESTFILLELDTDLEKIIIWEKTESD